MDRRETIRSIREQYDHQNWLKLLIIVGSLLLLLLMGMYFTTLGVSQSSIGQVVRAFVQGITGTLYDQTDAQSAERKIIFLMRMPRLVLAIFAGIGLSVSGIAMQGITRNPLVSPFTIGLSNAAAFGASLAIVFGLSVFPGTELGTVISAFTSTMVCALFVYAIAQRAGMKAESMVLAGIALSYIYSALTAGIEFFAAEHKLASVVQWTFGTFNGATWDQTLLVMAVVVVCTAVVWRYALVLNVMSSGEDELVRSLGVNPSSMRGLMGCMSVLMTAAIISFTGVIGFVGLVAPHIARMLMGNDHRYLIPFSGLVGAALLVVSDTIGRLILSPVSIPVGVVVSIIGVPLFINLILTRKKGDQS